MTTTLLANTGEDLKTVLESLTPEDVQAEMDSSTFYKGEQYYEWDLVTDVQYSLDKSRLTAAVEGSLDYTVTIALQEGSVRATCNCPVDGVCKHIAAVLLYAIREADAIEVGESREEGSRVYQHLMALSKEELVSRLLGYAPDEFLLEIHNRHASAEEARALYTRTEAAVHKLFSNTELLYSPADFSERLQKLLSRVAGLEHQLQEELSDLIFYIIREVENAFDKGYLFEDDYESSFELPDTFLSLVASYIQVLPYDAKTRFLKQLDNTLLETPYPVFESLAGLSQESFAEHELPAVKEMLLKEYQDLSVPLTEEYYVLVRPLLSESEKEQILHYLREMDSSWVLELAYMYREQGREEEAIDMIRTGLAANPEIYADEQVHLLYLDLLSTQGMDVREAAVEAIINHPGSSILLKIAATGTEDLSRYERMLEEKNPQGLLSYLEKAGRLQEALQLLQRNNIIWDHYRWVFFKKHVQDFPEEAVQYFSQTIEKNLEHTGNPYYYKIVEALQLIEQMDAPRSAAIAADIRAQYPDRPNLMNLLTED